METLDNATQGNAGSVVGQTLGNPAQENAHSVVGETFGNAQEDATNSGPTASETLGNAQKNVTDSNPTDWGSTQENTQNASIATSTSNGTKKAENGSHSDHHIAGLPENEFGEADFSLPYDGDHHVLAQLLDNWNRAHPMYPTDQLSNGSFPLSIFETIAPDEDFDLVNWTEIDAAAEADLREDEEDFFNTFFHLQQQLHQY